MEWLSDEEWQKHWNDPATDAEIARWRQSARHEMEHSYTHAEMDTIYPMSRGILRILARYDALRAERDALRATVAGLREALEVFVPQHFRDRGGDDMTGYYLEGKVVRLGDIRRAFAALAAAPTATSAPDRRDTNDG